MATELRRSLATGPQRNWGKHAWRSWPGCCNIIVLCFIVLYCHIVVFFGRRETIKPLEHWPDYWITRSQSIRKVIRYSCCKTLFCIHMFLAVGAVIITDFFVITQDKKPFSSVQFSRIQCFQCSRPAQVQRAARNPGETCTMLLSATDQFMSQNYCRFFKLTVSLCLGHHRLLWWCRSVQAQI